MALKDHGRLLLVEGSSDLFAVQGLMRHYVDWPKDKNNAPVEIKNMGGVDEILKDGAITAEAKAAAVRCLGIVLDADEFCIERYADTVAQCSSMFPAIPVSLPANGLVVDNDDGKRLGIWIMPDNKSSGMMETFLKFLVPTDKTVLWAHACDSVAGARSVGAEYHDVHLSKAELYTWLSWSNPPGQAAGLALTQRILDPKSPFAQPFVAWFRRLYNL